MMRGPPEGEARVGSQPVGEEPAALQRILPKLPLEKRQTTAVVIKEPECRFPE